MYCNNFLVFFVHIAVSKTKRRTRKLKQHIALVFRTTPLEIMLEDHVKYYRRLHCVFKKTSPTFSTVTWKPIIRFW